MQLKGITWDHARGYHPLLPITEAFCSTHPGVALSWAKRSLKDFGDYPVSKLVDNYDFILIDHPFMAEALQEKLLLVLNDHLAPGFLAELERESVGPSLDSYCVDGQYQGLPVDAATQVAAANMEVLSRLGVSVPKTLQEVLTLKDRLGGHFIGAAMAPTDIFSTYLSLVAQISDKPYFDPAQGIGLAAGETAAVLLAALAAAAHPDTFEMNPVQLLDEMSRNDKIVYTPYLYGYTNYSRGGFRPIPLDFWDAPLVREDAPVSTQLGGVGIAISARISAEKRPVAVEFAQYLASPHVQRGIYTQSDGQPAALSAWLDDGNNRMTRSFFRNTLHTLETAFLRPKVVKWNTFQEEASVVLHREIREKTEPQIIAQQFNARYRAICVSQ